MLSQNLLSITGQMHLFKNWLQFVFNKLSVFDKLSVCSRSLRHHINSEFICLLAYWQYKLISQWAHENSYSYRKKWNCTFWVTLLTRQPFCYHFLILKTPLEHGWPHFHGPRVFVFKIESQLFLCHCMGEIVSFRLNGWNHGFEIWNLKFSTSGADWVCSWAVVPESTHQLH